MVEVSLTRAARKAFKRIDKVVLSGLLESTYAGEGRDARVTDKGKVTLERDEDEDDE